MTMKNLDQVYKALDLNSTATKEEIRKAWIKLIKIHHPDLGGDAAKFEQIQQAYEILTDPVKLQAVKEGKDAFSVASKTKAARGIVINLFSKVINNRFVADYENLTKKMDAECNEMRRSTMDRIEDTDNYIQQLSVIGDRITKGDILKAEITKLVSYNKEKLDKLNRDMEEINIASDMIAEFEYSFDKDNEIVGALDYEYQGFADYKTRL